MGKENIKQRDSMLLKLENTLGKSGLHQAQPANFELCKPLIVLQTGQMLRMGHPHIIAASI